jgi:hypothetical protein
MTMTAGFLPGANRRNHGKMNLFLRRVRDPQARNNYRVIVKLDGAEIEVGSIGILGRPSRYEAGCTAVIKRKPPRPPSSASRWTSGEQVNTEPGERIW